MERRDRFYFYVNFSKEDLFHRERERERERDRKHDIILLRYIRTCI